MNIEQRRIVWGICIIIVVLGIIGVLGGSGVANAVAFPKDQSFRVEYDRMPHADNPFEVKITFATSTIASSTSSVQIELDNNLMKDFTVASVQPDTGLAGITGRSTAFVFRVIPGRSGEVLLTLIPKKQIGPVSGSIRLENSEAVPVSLFVLP